MVREPGEQTFLLGLGCQKGGTTWLHSYLSGSPQVDPGYRKEYHVFDVRDLSSEISLRNRIFDLAEQSLAAARRGDEADAAVLHRMALFVDDNYYFDFFASLLAKRAETRLTFDLTPRYGLLSAQRFTRIREGFEKRGIRPVALLVMRDPVERTWSQIRMRAQRYPDRYSAPPDQILRERYAAPSYADRNRYDQTLVAADAGFGPDAVHHEFYERLFSEDRIRAICSFLGIDYRDPDFDLRRNAAPKEQGVELPEETARMVAQHHAEVYRAVAERFPHVDLLRLWPHSRHVL